MNCIDCGKRVKETSMRCDECHRAYNRGENHPSWKGGGTVSVTGYIVLGSYGKRIPEQREVWERTHGMELPNGMIAHHLNGNIRDNRPTNIIAMTRSEHSRLHSLRYWRLERSNR